MATELGDPRCPINIVKELSCGALRQNFCKMADDYQIIIPFSWEKKRKFFDFSL
jgi:hypothetical protein